MTELFSVKRTITVNGEEDVNWFVSSQKRLVDLEELADDLVLSERETASVLFANGAQLNDGEFGFSSQESAEGAIRSMNLPHLILTDTEVGVSY